MMSPDGFESTTPSAVENDYASNADICMKIFSLPRAGMSVGSHEVQRMNR